MKPALEEVRKLAKNKAYRRIPVYRELLSDRFTPIEVMRTLRAASRHCYLLESADSHQKWGRYTFLGFDPLLELTCTNGKMRIRTGFQDEESSEEFSPATETFNELPEDVMDIISRPGTWYFNTQHPGEMIREILNAYKTPHLEGLPTFTGGLVGYFSYEYIQYGEPSLRALFDESGPFCDVDLMLFDRVIAFDHYRQQLILIAGVNTRNVEMSYREAERQLDRIEELLDSQAKAHFKPLHMEGNLETVFSEEAYCAMVEKARHYIREGDIFQVVLSNPMEVKATGSLFDAYRVLRTTNPSPYMFYFTSDNIEIAGASPETLAKLENGVLHTFPLAGTRPRGKTDVEDDRLEKELLADEKERAEHNMLVDLGRNDLGKISRLGSVKVEKYMQIQRFSHVMHIGTTVSGEIEEGKDAVDAVDAILPAGTLSGAPKIRACQIIRELEGRRRGVYGGAIGYLDFTGNLDTCISIRLAYKKNGKICVQSGAGIVADSVPQKEFVECRNKAQAVIGALTAAQGGIR
ncbi:anthranilate synthase component 1 [Catenibacillus scindens]|uniref:Anthranilate synthase component 1 n=1 Tax=Catenibacillus scindens TaxID=673271 RepID=A0A7W8M5Q6_9FIRM|nr:anthranilate synthase component I family protein [Catenibacillus scindens]MBB5265179.1 anthranilate synthase component 1 [Catenibacillus scindens]